MQVPANRRVALTVLVSALGYFVDIYDLILFAVVRKSSLQSIGVAAADMERAGGTLMSLQMAGMLTGGIVVVASAVIGRSRNLHWRVHDHPDGDLKHWKTTC